MNTKFTATMVTNEDKETVIAIRNEFNLTEKEAMELIIQTALDHKDHLRIKVDALKEFQQKEKDEKKAQKLELQLAALKGKVTKKAKKGKVTEETKEAQISLSEKNN